MAKEKESRMALIWQQIAVFKGFLKCIVDQGTFLLQGHCCPAAAWEKQQCHACVPWQCPFPPSLHPQAQVAHPALSQQ